MDDEVIEQIKIDLARFERENDVLRQALAKADYALFLCERKIRHIAPSFRSSRDLYEAADAAKAARAFINESTERNSPAASETRCRSLLAGV